VDPEWRQTWQEAIAAASEGYNPTYFTVLSLDIDGARGCGAVLVSGNDDPIYPYEERVCFSDGKWHGGNSGNGPSRGTSWYEDEDGDKYLWDMTFWLDVPEDADAVRFKIGDQSREVPARAGLAICFVGGVPGDWDERPTVLAYRRAGVWVTEMGAG
jgi:hypothetical protein